MELEKNIDCSEWPEGLHLLRLSTTNARVFLDFDNKYYYQSETPKDHQMEPYELKEIQRATAAGDILAALEDKQGQWAAVFWLSPQAEQGNMDIWNMVVRPDARGRGLGQQILRYTEKLARQEGLKQIRLDVDPLNARAMNLYLKNGYVANHYYYHDETSMPDHWLMMVKTLDKSLELGAEAYEVTVNDKEKIRLLIDGGWVAHQLILSADGNPRHNTLVLSRPVLD